MKIKMNRREWLKATAAAGAWLWTGVQFGAGRNDISYPDVLSNDGFIRLDNNENPYGIPPKAYRAINEAIKNSHRYPQRTS